MDTIIKYNLIQNQHRPSSESFTTYLTNMGLIEDYVKFSAQFDVKNYVLNNQQPIDLYYNETNNVFRYYSKSNIVSEAKTQLTVNELVNSTLSSVFDNITDKIFDC